MLVCVSNGCRHSSISAQLENTDYDDLHYCGTSLGSRDLQHLTQPGIAPASRHRSKNQTKEFPRSSYPGLHVKHRASH